jgi:hypothetical protein
MKSTRAIGEAGRRTTLLLSAFFMPEQALLVVQTSTEPMPQSASFHIPAEILVLAVIGTHGYSSAAIVPGSVFDWVTALVATVEQEESV